MTTFNETPVLGREAFDAWRDESMKRTCLWPDSWSAWQAATLAERERCINIIETYKVSVGNSRSGELAAEMTMDSLRDLRDEIRNQSD